jgi:hypothetical protein
MKRAVLIPNAQQLAAIVLMRFGAHTLVVGGPRQG